MLDGGLMGMMNTWFSMGLNYWVQFPFFLWIFRHTETRWEELIERNCSFIRIRHITIEFGYQPSV